MTVYNCEKKNKVCDTIKHMFAIIFLSTLILSIFKTVASAIRDFDYGRIDTKEFDTVYKESLSFKKF